MKLKHSFFILSTSAALLGGIQSVVAQGSTTPSLPAQTATIPVAPAQGSALPATPEGNTGGGVAVSSDARGDRNTTVYLSKDYTKVLSETKLFDSDKFTAVFVRFESDFAIFKQAGSREQIYIPNSAILYMRGPGEPTLNIRY